MVTAIGEPPKEKICAFRNLVNVVVFPSIGKWLVHLSHLVRVRLMTSQGERSFTSRLSGGDLDGFVSLIIAGHT